MTVISTQYASGIVAATEKAAIASSKLIGLGDESSRSSCSRRNENSFKRN